jgi:hypothetical protein
VKHESPRTSYARTTSYDEKFRDELTEQIVTVIGESSLVTDANVMAIRIGETADALASCLIAVMAMSPRFDNHHELRVAAVELAKRVRRDVACARADPNFAADFIGTRKGGNA